MTGELAGILASKGVSGSRATAALGRPDGSQAVTEGPLDVAWWHPTAAEPTPPRLLVFLDGRIDNAGELAKELAKSPSEPETLLAHAYDRWGSRTPERLRGNFALLIWDRDRRQGVLAVDQLGARPLFLHATSSRLAFASEVRTLLRLLPTRPAPDDESVVRYITDGFTSHGRTLFADVQRLEGGCLLELSESEWHKRRYWSPRYQRPLNLSRSEAAQAVKQALIESVRRRADPEHETGVLMSGGLDSSSVAAAARELDRDGVANFRLYSATYPNHPSVDESAQIESLVTHLELPNSRIELQPRSVLAEAVRFQKLWELPFLSPGLVFSQVVFARGVNEGVFSFIDGEGGDELFGAPHYLIADRFRVGRIVSAAKLARRLPAPTDHLRWKDVRWRVQTLGLQGAIPHVVHRAARRVRNAERYTNDLLRADAARLYLESENPWPWKASSGPRWWAHLAYLLTTWREQLGAHDLLRRRAGLAGVENGHPLLQDLDLIELMLRVPPELSFDHHHSRPLLREAMAGLIPDAVRLRREKAEFTQYYLDCMRGPDGDAIAELVTAPAAEIRRYVRPEVVEERLVRPMRKGEGVAWGVAAWRLATAELWLQSQK